MDRLIGVVASRLVIANRSHINSMHLVDLSLLSLGCCRAVMALEFVGRLGVAQATGRVICG